MCATAMSGSSIKAKSFLSQHSVHLLFFSMKNRVNISRGVLLYLIIFSVLAEAKDESVNGKHRISYFKNGEIHVNQLGQPDKKPLTSGHWDFKPSWSKTGDKLVFFRR